MKLIALICGIELITCLAGPAYCSFPPTVGIFQPPPISFIEASKIAQSKLDSLKLSPEHFIRSIEFFPRIGPDETPAFYRALFDLNPISIDRTKTPNTAHFRYIKVTMDGKAVLITEEKIVSPLRH